LKGYEPVPLGDEIDDSSIVEDDNELAAELDVAYTFLLVMPV